MAQPIASLGLLRPAACTRSSANAARSIVPFINGARRRLAFRSRAWRARLVGCRVTVQPADIQDEYVEAHAQPIDASTLSSNHWIQHDTASQTVHQLQDLVAQMIELEGQVHEELHAGSEWQPTASGGFTIEADTQQKFKETYREVRKQEQRQAKREKAAAAEERARRRAARASSTQHLSAVAPLSVVDSSVQQQQPAAFLQHAPQQQQQQQQPEQLGHVESAVERKAKRAQMRLERSAPAAASPAALQQQPAEQPLPPPPQQQPPAVDAAAAAAAAVVQRRQKQPQVQQQARTEAQQQPAGRPRRRRSSTSAAAAAAAGAAAGAAPAPPQTSSSSSSITQQPEQQPAASRGQHVTVQAAVAEAAPEEAAVFHQLQHPKEIIASLSASSPAAAAASEDAATPAAVSTALSQPLSSSSSSSAELGFKPLVLQRSPVAARGSAAARASRRVVRGAGASSSSRNRPVATGAAALAMQATQPTNTAPVPELRKLVDNNINGLDMRVDLLSADQERDLASMVQDLLQLEALAKELSQSLGRLPNDYEWMEAAGAGPEAADAGPEDVRAAVQLFQGRLQHGRAAKQVMISANYKLVVSICRKYVGYGMALGDLINEGIAGLVKGVERFQPSKGCKFSTYAHWWIRQSITRSLQEQGRLVRLPSHLQEMLTKMTKVSRAFEAQYGREATLADLAAELGVDAAKIADAYEAVFTHRSLDQPMGDGEGATLGDVLEDERALGPDDAAYVESLKHDLEGVLANLPAREAGVLRMRFGLVDGTEHTLDEIGLQFNVTRERIRQIEAKAIRQLRARQLQPGSVIADYQEGSNDKVLASRTSSGTRKQS